MTTSPEDANLIEDIANTAESELSAEAWVRAYRLTRKYSGRLKNIAFSGVDIKNKVADVLGEVPVANDLTWKDKVSDAITKYQEMAYDDFHCRCPSEKNR